MYQSHRYHCTVTVQQCFICFQWKLRPFPFWISFKFSIFVRFKPKRCSVFLPWISVDKVYTNFKTCFKKKALNQLFRAQRQKKRKKFLLLLRPLPFTFFLGFFRLKIAGNEFWQFFFLHNFWPNRTIFLGKYFKNPVKDCEFADRQHILKGFTLILIFGYVVLNKIFLIFQWLQIKKKQYKSSFFLSGTPL